MDLVGSLKSAARNEIAMRSKKRLGERNKIRES
jgi:hypothetical protein